MFIEKLLAFVLMLKLLWSLWGKLFSINIGSRLVSNTLLLVSARCPVSKLELKLVCPTLMLAS